MWGKVNDPACTRSIGKLFHTVTIGFLSDFGVWTTRGKLTLQLAWLARKELVTIPRYRICYNRKQDSTQTWTSTVKSSARERKSYSQVNAQCKSKNRNNNALFILTDQLFTTSQNKWIRRLNKISWTAKANLDKFSFKVHMQLSNPKLNVSQASEFRKFTKKAV